MNRKLKLALLIACCALLVTAVASPALGGPSITSIGKTAKKALRTGKQAQRRADSAYRLANGADSAATKSADLAATADTKADQALARPVINPGGIGEVAGPKNSYAPGEVGLSIAQCPAGQRAISGGGAAITGLADGLAVSQATSDRSSWFVIAGNNASIDATIQAFAYCVPGGTAVAANRSGTAARAEAARLIRQLEAKAAHSCGPGYTHAALSWGHKCVRAGQYCKQGKNREYHRYDFHCKSNGRLRRY